MTDLYNRVVRAQRESVFSSGIRHFRLAVVLAVLVIAFAGLAFAKIPPNIVVKKKSPICLSVHALVKRVVDGDTFDVYGWLDVDLFAMRRVRIVDIDAPDRGDDGYKESKSALQSILPVERWVHLNVCSKDAFGRWIANVTDDSNINVGDWMIKQGHAIKWQRSKSGKKKK